MIGRHSRPTALRPDRWRASQVRRHDCRDEPEHSESDSEPADPTTNRQGGEFDQVYPEHDQYDRGQHDGRHELEGYEPGREQDERASGNEQDSEIEQPRADPRLVPRGQRRHAVEDESDDE